VDSLKQQQQQQQHTMSDSTSPSWSTDKGTFSSASQADSSKSRVVISFEQAATGFSDTVCTSSTSTVEVSETLSTGRLADAFNESNGQLTIPEDGLYRIHLSATATWATEPDSASCQLDTYTLEVYLNDVSLNDVAGTRSSCVGEACDPGRLDLGLATSGTSVVSLSADDVLTLRCVMNEVVTVDGSAVASATTSSRSVSCVVSRVD